jgi:hypothetical protein
MKKRQPFLGGKAMNERNTIIKLAAQVILERETGETAMLEGMRKEALFNLPASAVTNFTRALNNSARFTQGSTGLRRMLGRRPNLSGGYWDKMSRMSEAANIRRIMNSFLKPYSGYGR